MAETLTLSDLNGRIASLTLSTSANYAHWDSTRKTQLVNDAQYEVFKLLVEMFDETYFFTVSDAIVPTNNTISLSALSPPFYRLRGFQRIYGSEWKDVELVTPRDTVRRGQFWQERWYPASEALRSDSATALTGTYRILYNHRIAKLSNDGDVCEIPPEYAEIVGLFGAKMASLQAKANDSYAVFMAEIEQRKAEMKKSAANRMAARKRRVIDTLGLQGAGDYIIIGDRS